jgi:CO/xanthine dehydrogenase Mo-binding subunit
MSPRFAGADAWLKVAGEATYTVDVQLPRMLHARVLRSAHPRARIRSVDMTAARRLPGVRAVITAADLSDYARRARVLASDRVVSRADAIAAVAADSEEIASRALDLIAVEYEPLPGVFDIRTAIEPASPTLYPDRSAAKLPADQAVQFLRPQAFSDLREALRFPRLAPEGQVRHNTQGIQQPHAAASKTLRGG